MPKFPVQEVTDLDIAFGGKAMQLLPSSSEIPKEFYRIGGFGASKWNKFVSDWFYEGSKIKDLRITYDNEVVDLGQAMRHLRAIIGSFEPKHEHKMAGCAYLCSLWFEDLVYEKAK